MFKHFLKNPESDNAMKQTCVIFILAFLPDYKQKCTDNADKTLKYHFLHWISLYKMASACKLLNIIISSVCHEMIASMTFRRKPFRRMRHIVEYDITSNATIRRNYVERQFVECKSVENSSKIGRKMRIPK